MNVNLQVFELEQHIYGMMDVERGVTKDRLTIIIYIYINISHSHSSYPFSMWGSFRLAPIMYKMLCIVSSCMMSLLIVKYNM